MNSMKLTHDVATGDLGLAAFSSAFGIGRPLGGSVDRQREPRDRPNEAGAGTFDRARDVRVHGDDDDPDRCRLNG